VESWIGFAGVFLAGAVVGGFVSLRFARSFVQARGAPGDQFVASNLKRLQDRLQLSAGAVGEDRAHRRQQR
jgi:hypothetical protein